MHNKPSSLGSAKGFNNDELKLLVESVPLENQFAAIPDSVSTTSDDLAYSFNSQILNGTTLDLNGQTDSLYL